MPTPTKAQTEDVIGKVMFMLNELELYGTTNAENLLQHETDILEAPLRSDRHERVSSAVKAFRSGAAGLLELGRSMLDPLLEDLAEAIGSNSTDPDEIMDDYYDDMIANGDTVLYRNITHGSITAGGSNVGNGVAFRNVLDAEAHEIENIRAPQTITYRCTADATTGTDPGEEEWTWTAPAPGEDEFNRVGTGSSGTFTTHSSDSSELPNSSFGQFEGTIAAPTDIVSWEVGSDIANFQIDQTNFFRRANNEETAGALRIEATDTIFQEIADAGVELDLDGPYLLTFRFNRAVYTASGTLVARAGTTNNSVAVAAQTGWNVHNLLIDENLWSKNMYEEDLDIMVDWTRTAGDILIDELIFQKMEDVDGTYVSIQTGQTLWAVDDEWTAADTTADTGIRQKWNERIYGKYLPHATAAPTIAEPT